MLKSFVPEAELHQHTGVSDISRKGVFHP